MCLGFESTHPETLRDDLRHLSSDIQSEMCLKLGYLYLINKNSVGINASCIPNVQSL